SVGLVTTWGRVSKGRLTGSEGGQVSAVPSGLDRQRAPVPTLKRWAIARCPSRTGSLRRAELLFGLSGMLLLAFAAGTQAATHYVDQHNTNSTPPYTSGITAATNIQAAVEAAVSGDEIVVTNGTYAGGVGINKPLTVRSVSGPQFTTIAGGGPCV